MTNPQDGLTNPQDGFSNPQDGFSSATDEVTLTTSEAELIHHIVETLHSKKAEDLLLLDLRDVSDVADFFLLATGTSDMHIKSLADDLVDRLQASGERPWHVEGLEQRRWVLIDLVHVVIHLFSPDAREFYSLERLWGDAKSMTFEDSAAVPPAGVGPTR